MKKFFLFIYTLISYLSFLVAFTTSVIWFNSFDEDCPILRKYALFPNIKNSIGSAPLRNMVGLGKMHWNALLILLFGVVHSVMASAKFKQHFYGLRGGSVLGTANFILLSSVQLLLTMKYWEPLNTELYSTFHSAKYLSLLGFAMVPLASFAIDHFAFVGVKQSFLALLNREYKKPMKLSTSFPYSVVRHPMMFGFFIGLWSQDSVTESRVLFASGMSLYILIGVYMEERKLLREFGPEYRKYKQEVSAFIPFLFGNAKAKKQ